MTDEEILKTIEASVHASSAMSLFLNHAFCLLAQQSGVDLRKLIEGIQSLQPQKGADLFQTTYTASKDQLLSNLEELCREQTGKS